MRIEIEEIHEDRIKELCIKNNICSSAAMLRCILSDYFTMYDGGIDRVLKGKFVNK